MNTYILNVGIDINYFLFHFLKLCYLYNQVWDSMNINVISYIKNDEYRGLILGDLTEIFQLLEDNVMTLQGMAGSQYGECNIR